MTTIRAFDHVENKHVLYREKYCMKNFFTPLKEHVKNIINFEKKKMLPLPKEEPKSHEDVKVCYIFRKRILKKFTKSINYWKI